VKPGQNESTSLASCNLKNRGVWFHTLLVKTTNSQRHEKRALIVSHFNLSGLFFYRRCSQPGVHVPVGAHCLSQGVHLMHSSNKLTLRHKNGIYFCSSKNLEVV